MRFALAMMMLLPATMALAEPASNAERRLFCKTIDAALEEEQADMALDAKACRTNAAIVSEEIAGGKRALKGKLKFRAPGRPSFELACDATYQIPLTAKSVATLGACQ